MSEKDILTKKSLDIEDNLAKTEENFIASYGKHEQKPLQILLSLYKGHYLQLILSGIFLRLSMPVYGFFLSQRQVSST